MYQYRVFGLSVSSDVRLNELSPEPDSNRKADIRIVITDIGVESLPMGSAPPYFDYLNEAGILMVWPGVAGFRIVGPDLIEIQPHPDASEKYLAFPILGPIMAWVLHMRQFFVLHASAVLWHGHSIAFMGDKLAGKSTTAAAFIGAGAEILTDDLLAIDMIQPNNPTIKPAFAQLKLSDDAAANVSLPNSKALPLVFEGFEKRQIRLADMYDQPTRCDTLFVLRREGNAPKIEWYSSEMALQGLMRYSYNVRFHDAPIEMQDRARHFKQCAALVNHARVGCLTIPVGIDSLPETVEFVKNTLSLGSP